MGPEGDDAAGKPGPVEIPDVAGQEFRPLIADLERQQASFDEALQPLLAKDQWKRYQHWRDEQRKQAEQEWKDRRRPPA